MKYYLIIAILFLSCNKEIQTEDELIIGDVNHVWTIDTGNPAFNFYGSDCIWVIPDSAIVEAKIK